MSVIDLHELWLIPRVQPTSSDSQVWQPTSSREAAEESEEEFADKEDRAWAELSAQALLRWMDENPE